MYKKLYSLFIIISLCLYVICPVSAKGDVVLSASEATGTVGSEINVTVSIENGRNVYGGSFNICYDESVLEIIDCTKGTVFGNISPVINKAYAPGKIRIIWTAASSIADGELFSLSFRGKSVGTSGIEFEKVKLSDISVTPLSYTLTASTVTVYEVSGEPEMKSITVISPDNASLKLSDGEYEYTVEELDGFYIAGYDESGRIESVSESMVNTFLFSTGNVLLYTKVFAWDSNMKPLRKAVSFDKEGVIKGFADDGTNLACAEVINKSAISEDFVLYIEQYNLNGTLIKLESETQRVGQGETKILNKEFVPDKNCVSVKIYVCDGENVQLGEAVLLEI